MLKTNYMKRIAAFVFGITCALTSMAQFPGAGGAGKSVPNIGHVYGKIVDSLGKPIADATVIILQNKFDSVAKKRKDVLLKGLSTKPNGEFSFEELPLF